MIKKTKLGVLSISLMVAISSIAIGADNVSVNEFGVENKPVKEYSVKVSIKDISNQIFANGTTISCAFPARDTSAVVLWTRSCGNTNATVITKSIERAVKEGMGFEFQTNGRSMKYPVSFTAEDGRHLTTVIIDINTASLVVTPTYQ